MNGVQNYDTNLKRSQQLLYKIDPPPRAKTKKRGGGKQIRTIKLINNQIEHPSLYNETKYKQQTMHSKNNLNYPLLQLNSLKPSK